MAREIAEKRVIVYPKGVWNKEETLTFYENGNGAAGDSFVTQAADAKKVNDAAIETIAAMKNLRWVDLSGTAVTPAGLARLTPKYRETSDRQSGIPLTPHP